MCRCSRSRWSEEAIPLLTSDGSRNKLFASRFARTRPTIAKRQCAGTASNGGARWRLLTRSRAARDSRSRTFPPSNERKINSSSIVRSRSCARARARSSRYRPENEHEATGSETICLRALAIVERCPEKRTATHVRPSSHCTRPSSHCGNGFRNHAPRAACRSQGRDHADHNENGRRTRECQRISRRDAVEKRAHLLRSDGGGSPPRPAGGSRGRDRRTGVHRSSVCPSHRSIGCRRAGRSRRDIDPSAAPIASSGVRTTTEYATRLCWKDESRLIEIQDEEERRARGQQHRQARCW